MWQSIYPSSLLPSSSPFSPKVSAEYRRAVEAIGAHALTSFLVPDSKAAYELLSHLKGEGEGGGGAGKKKPTVSITVVPLKEVGELQRRREASNRACLMRKAFLQTLLDDEDEEVHVLPLPEVKTTKTSCLQSTFGDLRERRHLSLFL